MAFDDVDPLAARQSDYRLAGDAVEEAVWRGRVQGAILDEEHVRTRALGNIAAIVQHHGVGIAVFLCRMFGDGTDHVEAGGLGVYGLCFRRRAFILGPAHADALGLFLGLEIVRPIPDRDGDVDFRTLGGNPNHFAAAPSDRAQIGVAQPVLGAGVLAGLIDLGHRERDFEVEDLG